MKEGKTKNIAKDKDSVPDTPEGQVNLQSNQPDASEEILSLKNSCEKKKGRGFLASKFSLKDKFFFGRKLSDGYLMLSAAFLLTFFSPIPLLQRILPYASMFLMAVAYFIFFRHRKELYSYSKNKTNAAVLLGMLSFFAGLAVVLNKLIHFLSDSELLSYFFVFGSLSLISYFLMHAFAASAALILGTIHFSKKPRKILILSFLMAMTGAIYQVAAEIILENSLDVSLSDAMGIALSMWLSGIAGLIFSLLFFLRYIHSMGNPVYFAGFIAPVLYSINGEKKYRLKQIRKKENRTPVIKFISFFILITGIILSSSYITISGLVRHSSGDESDLPPALPPKYPDDYSKKWSGSLRDAPTPFLIRYNEYKIDVLEGAETLDVVLKGSGGGPTAQLNLIVSGPAAGKSTNSGVNQQVVINSPIAGTYTLRVECTNSRLTSVDYELFAKVIFPK